MILDDGRQVYQRDELYEGTIALDDADSEDGLVTSPDGGNINIVRFRFQGSEGVAYYTIIPSRIFGFQTGTGIRLLFVSLLFFLLIPAVGSWIFLRGLKRQLSGLEVAASAIAGGSLDLILEVLRDPAIAPVFEAYERMRSMLNDSEEYRHRFLLAISHDLKSPLTSILGYVEVIRDQVYDSVEEQQRYLDVIRDKSFLLEQRIQELIDFAKIETLDWQRNFERIDAEDFLRAVAETFAEESPVRGVEFDFQVEIPANTHIHGDRRMLHRAFENLFENSIRYCPRGSRVSVSAREEAGYVIIDFDDSGPGIPDAEKERVFEHFYRGESSRSAPGTGLGLNSAQSIIHSHRGKLSLQDSPLGGVRFTIQIPTASDQEPFPATVLNI